MSQPSEPETSPTRNAARRKFLTLATTAVGGVGVVGAAVPFVQYWQPSAKARAGAAPIRVDLVRLAPGALLTDSWAGKPVWVLRRDPEMIATLENPELIGALSDADSTVEPNSRRTP